MKIRSSRKPVLTLESVAMTDIVMNMFIFFFVSFSLLYTFSPARESKIKVNLPKGMTTVKSKGETPLVVTVSARNEIYIGADKIAPGDIARAFTRQAQSAKQNGVIVKADRQASVDYFVKVLDAAKQAGIDKVSVSIEVNKKTQ